MQPYSNVKPSSTILIDGDYVIASMALLVMVVIVVVDYRVALRIVPRHSRQLKQPPFFTRISVAAEESSASS